MRAPNTLSPAKTEGLLNVTKITVHGLEMMSYASAGIPIITLTVTVMQMVIVSSCQQLKGVCILQLMEGSGTSNSKFLKSTEYQ